MATAVVDVPSCSAYSLSREMSDTGIRQPTPRLGSGLGIVMGGTIAEVIAKLLSL